MDETEELRQEVYSLKNKLSSAASQEAWYHEEIAQLQTMRKQDLDIQDALKEEVVRLQRKIGTLEEDIDQHKSSENNLKSQIQSLEKLVESNKTINETLSHSIMTEDNTQLMNELCSLQNENTQLKGDLIEMKHDCQSAIIELENLKQKMINKEQEMEELQCQITTYVNTIEKCRTEIMELNAQIDVLQMESQTQSCKGNSLFSEVEDRRVKAEKLVKKYQLSNQQLNQQIHKLKMQMFTCLGLSKEKSDDSRIQKLQSEVCQLQEEKKQLLEEIHRAPKSEIVLQGDVERTLKAGEVSSGEDYVKYLLSIIEASNEETAKLKNEVKAQKMLLLAEKDTVLSLERKQYDIETQREKTRALYLKEKLKVEELRAKYEPEKMKNEPASRRGKLEKLPSVSDNSLKEVKCERKRRESSRAVRELHLDETAVNNENTDPESDTAEKRTDSDIEYKKTKSVSLSDEIKMMDTEGGVEIGSLSQNDHSESCGSYEKPVKSKGRKVANIVKAEIPDSKVNECSPQ
ncbi:protein Spindly-B-like [Saccostrea echinata]|uniref:protein Spindly-B-like n=1 Tax=Saccostrea echinata TaxID=191078 RepID=UPI002A82E020|nr:protein Spindly-B-like [Saccostrea echinata]